MLLSFISVSAMSVSAYSQNTYTDENNLLTLTYPSEWTLLPDDGMAPGFTNGEIDFRVTASPYTGLDTVHIPNIYNAEYRQMLQYSLSSVLNTMYEVTDYGTIVLDGVDAYYMLMTGTKGEREGKNLYFLQTQTPNSIVSLYIEGPKDEVTVENKSLAEIISSINFTE
jgi:hypothetical protein